jgi:hypothetical protein
LGAVGLDWQLGGFGVDPATNDIGDVGQLVQATNDTGDVGQLVQAMAGFGGGSQITSSARASSVGGYSSTSCSCLSTRRAK